VDSLQRHLKDTIVYFAMPYRKIAFFTIIVILLITINNLIHSIYATWQKQDLIVQAQKNLSVEKEENQRLKKDIAQVNKPQFIESEARDKLLLAKPGEGIVILPKNQLHAPLSSVQHIVDKRPNWQKWWNLFFQSS
jgi:cell division protein FtsB